MIETLTKSIAELVIISPLIILSLNKNVLNKWLLLGLFCCFFIFNSILLDLPREIPALKLIDGNWNWSGKLYAIFGSIIFYLTFKKYFPKNDFIKLNQSKGSLRTSLIWLLIISLISILMGLFMFGKSEFNWESLGFQITMPGFDEELAYRGILIGLLATFLIDEITIKNRNYGSPAVWITAILFGLIHAFKIKENWQFQMDWIYFSYTFLFGFVLGWITLKSKSILFPVLTHNAANFLGALVTMIK